MMEISVIIPTIGRNSLKNALESVANQTYKEIETIVTDDTSEQRAKALVETFRLKYPQLKIKYVVNTRYKRGPSGNQNNGLGHANGKYITFLGDDDVLLPQAIDKAVSIVQEKNLDVLIANCISNIRREKTGLSYGKSEEISYYDFLRGKYDGDYFILVKRDLIGDDRFPEDAWGAEIVLFLKVFKRSQKIYYFDEIFKINNCLPNINRVTLQMATYPDRQALNYYYLISEFYEDLLKFAPKQLWRYAVRGMYFSKLSSNNKKCLWFFKKSLVNIKLSILSLAYFCFLLICPKKLFQCLMRGFLKNSCTL
ncbi:MAG: glycosyltransferase family 2 protein [Nitrososphaeria archaeon]